MDGINDHKWAKRIQEGDDRAFEQLFKTYYFQLSRFAWRYVDSKVIAEELAQLVFTNIWEKRADWEPVNIKAYLYGAVKNRAIDHIRKQGVRRKYSSKLKKDREPATINVDNEDRRKQIQKAIKTEIEALPSRSKMTFKLHRYDGLTYKEIAEVMGVSVKTVESQMTRTLKRLRERLSDLLPLLDE